VLLSVCLPAAARFFVLRLRRALCSARARARAPCDAFISRQSNKNNQNSRSTPSAPLIAAAILPFACWRARRQAAATGGAAAVGMAIGGIAIVMCGC
jgi:hypothetical protein